MARWSWLILAFYVVLAVSAQESTSTLDKAAGETTTTANSEVKTVKTTTSRAQTTNGTTTQLTTETDVPTTTEAPTTPTTAPTTTTKATTTPVPAPTPEPPKWPENIGQWNVTEAKNKSVACLIIHAALEVNLKITEEKKTSTVNVLVPKTAVANGTCGDETNAIELNWHDSGYPNVLLLTFKKNNVTQGKEGYALSEIYLSVNNNGTQTSGNSNASTPHFQTPISQSYRCSKETPIAIKDDIELRVSSLQLEAFRTVPNDKFNEALECSGDDVSAVVPFAVGASLALLVVIVLIAYLIGRRRSRARGYQSV